MRYLQRARYRVRPVNAVRAGTMLHGERVLGRLAEAGAVDLVNVLSRSEAIGAVVDEAIASGPPAIWTQLGTWNDGALARAKVAGLRTVSGRCIRVEQSRLVRSGREGGV